MLCSSLVLIAQTTLYLEDFTGQNGQGAVGPGNTVNTGAVPWTVDISNVDLTANDDWFRVQNEVFEAQDVDGTQGPGGSGSGAVWISPSINISGATNVSISLDVSQVGTFESEDFIRASYQIDGGGLVSFGFLNDDFAPATFSVSGLSGNNLQIFVEIDNNAAAERIRFDNVLVTALIPTNDTDTEVYEQVPQPASATISSLADTEPEAVDVFNFRIEDQGSGDALPTVVTNIRIQPAASNTADWTDHIQGLTLSGNTLGNITLGTPIITDTYIDLPITAGNLNVADGAAEDLTLGIYLNTNGILDNAIFSCFIDDNGSGFGADLSGSSFADPFALGDVTSNDFPIEVQATTLAYLQQPIITVVNTVMSQPVEIAAVDANGNVDLDFDGPGAEIGLTTTGSFAPSATTQVQAVNGVASFSNLIFDATATNIILQADDITNLVTAATFDSDVFDVVNTFVGT